MSIFQRIQRYFKRRRMRRSLRVRAYAGKRGVSRVHSSPLIPIIKIVVIVILIAAAGFAIYKWGIPLGKQLFGPSEPEPTPSPIATPTPPPATYAKADMSDLEEEILIPHWFISDPYYFGGKIVYTSGQIEATAPPAVENLLVFDIASSDYTRIETPERLTVRNNYFEPKMNEYWIVWMETVPKGGGRVMAYDKRTNTSFVLREYTFGMPKLQLSGNYCMFTVSTGANSDKLYLYDLENKESLMLRSFKYNEEPFSLSRPSICESEMIWIDGMDAETGVTTIKAYKIKDGIAFEQSPYLINSYVFDPLTNGEVIVFLNTQRSLDGDLMVSVGGGEPVVVATGVLNFDLGDHYIAYTKDEAVYVYYWEDGSTGRLSNSNSRAILASVTENVALWYDITDGLIGDKEKDRDVLMMATVPFEK